MGMHYAIRHVTRYRYSEPVRESIMQLYLQPRSDSGQWLRSIQISTTPRAQIFAYTDYLGNAVYHFDVPQPHSSLIVDVESTVETTPLAAVASIAAGQGWNALDEVSGAAEHYDFVTQSAYTEAPPTLPNFVIEHGLTREEVRAAGAPLDALRRLNTAIHDAFEYDQESTEVDSPISHALELGRGVCQDFAHIMLSVARSWGLPSRYVSGYLFHEGGKDRSVADASHAWVECFVPGAGWLGFDPTNNLIVADRHIRVAVGRDYADVPPTKGVYKGRARGELAVAVKVTKSKEPARQEDFLRVVRPMRMSREVPAAAGDAQQQQQQQQQ